MSDTIFLIGSGPSINDVTGSQWRHIGEQDSFGVNFSFLTGRKTTHYYLGYEKGSLGSIREAFGASLRNLYSGTKWYVPTKVWGLVNPKKTPKLFPTEPNVVKFKFPKSVELDSDRPFRATDFKGGLVYRGAMSVALHLIKDSGYKSIVLMGVDLHTFRHFFDDFEVMRKERAEYNRKMAPGVVFESMIPKGKRYRTMEEYYYAVNELYFQPKGIELYDGNKGNMLSPRIPLYDWGKN